MSFLSASRPHFERLTQLKVGARVSRMLYGPGVPPVKQVGTIVVQFNDSFGNSRSVVEVNDYSSSGYEVVLTERLDLE